MYIENKTTSQVDTLFPCLKGFDTGILSSWMAQDNVKAFIGMVGSSPIKSKESQHSEEQEKILADKEQLLTETVEPPTVQPRNEKVGICTKSQNLFATVGSLKRTIVPLSFSQVGSKKATIGLAPPPMKKMTVPLKVDISKFLPKSEQVENIKGE